MKLGIMQPYFFPYIGYWQLMNYVDQYVIYDDVNFIKGGWINRNRILNHGKVQFFNLTMKGASPNKRINQIEIETDERIIRKNLRMIENCYGKAPYYKQTYELIRDMMFYKDSNLAGFLANSIMRMAEYLNMNTKFILSSRMEKNNDLRGQDKVIHICRLLGADEYDNASGGRELYDYDSFEKQGICLKFIETGDISYQQFGGEFVPNLSMIDVLMFNSREKVKEYLRKFDLIQRQELQ